MTYILKNHERQGQVIDTYSCMNIKHAWQLRKLFTPVGCRGKIEEVR